MYINQLKMTEVSVETCFDGVVVFFKIDPTFKSGSQTRGGEWYLEKRGSRKILAGSRNLGSVYDKS